MDTFDIIKKGGLEQLIFCHDEAVGMKAVVAIHDTRLGPAIGGLRIHDYHSQEEMVKDAVDLSMEMTLRASLAGCDLGGGAAIIWGSPQAKSEALLRAFGRVIKRLAGQFLVTTEVGTDGHDLYHLRRETEYTYSLPEGLGGIADPNAMTADGVFQGIRATAKVVLGKGSLEGVTCLVQGAGRMGSALVRLLAAAKAKLIISDRNYDKIKNIQDAFPEIAMVRPEEVRNTKCDILVPCALGPLVDRTSADSLRCKAVAGGASLFLPDLETGDLLHKHGVVYTPHFLIDAGELLQADHERRRQSAAQLRSAVAEIYPRTVALLEMAREAKEAPLRTAVRQAWSRLTAITRIGQRTSPLEVKA